MPVRCFEGACHTRTLVNCKRASRQHPCGSSVGVARLYGDSVVVFCSSLFAWNVAISGGKKPAFLQARA